MMPGGSRAADLDHEGSHLETLLSCLDRSNVSGNTTTDDDHIVLLCSVSIQRSVNFLSDSDSSRPNKPATGSRDRVRTSWRREASF